MTPRSKTGLIVSAAGAAIALAALASPGLAREAHEQRMVPVADVIALAMPKLPDAPKPMPPPPPPAPPPPPPKIEVVFALDTTGSMGDLLSGAKQKIWSIASHIATGQPTPELSIGLVAYRDIGDAYVTKVYQLSGDLETVFKRLKSFRADGGGDEPEHVWRGLSDAVNKMQWSDGATKMVFLVGDAPPHSDYRDGYSRSKILEQAAKKQIVIHAIRAGSSGETATVWSSLAKAGGGAYASIDQRGGWRASKTPMDARLAELSRELDKTTIGYGDAEVHKRISAKATSGLGGGAAMDADRGSFIASTGAKNDANDILGDLISGKVDVNSLDVAKLPEAMRPMSPEQRTAYVAQQKARRDQVMKEMKELSAQRNAYLKAERKAPAAAKRPASMDDVVNGAIEKQAEAAGVSYE